MPINLVDRLQISTFIRQTPSFAPFVGLAYQGGPCAAFVKAIIETSTRKQILNPTQVFGYFSNRLSLHSRIDNLFQLQLLQEGDILCVVSKKDKERLLQGQNLVLGDVKHYVLKVNIDDYEVIGTNGNFNMQAHQIFPHKDASLTRFFRNAFSLNYYDNTGTYRGNVYWYNDWQRECELYRVDYSLM